MCVFCCAPNTILCERGIILYYISGLVGTHDNAVMILLDVTAHTFSIHKIYEP